MQDKTTKQVFWANHITQQETSGLSQQAYCQQQELTLHQMVYWRRKLRSLADSSASRGGFVAMPIPPPQTAGLTVTLSSGIRISGFRSGDDVAHLLRALA